MSRLMLKHVSGWIRAALGVALVVLSVPARATVGYALSVYNPPAAPDQDWWGSLIAVTNDFIATPTTFAPDQLMSCVIIFPDGHRCLGAVFDPRGSAPDAVTFITDFTAQTFEFPDGTFLNEGGYNALDGRGGIIVTPGIPEPGSVVLLLAGLGTLALGMRRRHGAIAAGTAVVSQ